LGEARVHAACNTVKLACFDGRMPVTKPLYAVVRPGMWFTPYCVVKMCSPNPCFLHPSSNVDVVDYVEVSVERLEHNYMITVMYVSWKGDATRTEYYVYPIKIWEKVMNVVSPLQEDRPPRNPGVILIGPPGTGKTSLMRILPDYLGLSVVEVGAEHVLSKWVGDSEKVMAYIFDKAESIQPSVILVDEGDWILSPSRETIGLSDVMQNILDIVKRKLAEYYKRGIKTLTVFSANLPESAIDPTLKREGRCGKPIIIPLPDFEAVYSYLTTAVRLDPTTAERMALDAVNAGLSMADVVQMANTFLETRRYYVEAMKYRGYRRHVVPANVLADHDVRALLDDLENAFWFTNIMSYRRSRVWVSDLDAVISLPVISAVVGLKVKKPVVIIDHWKFLDEAMDMINLLGAVSVVVDWALHPEYVKTMWMTSDFPIVFVGRENVRNYVEVHQMNISGVIHQHRVGTAKLVAMTYGINLSEQQLSRLRSVTHENFVKELTELALTGRVVSPFK